ncbi:MAG: hypothetical protein R3F43_11720 [bacterium]
MPDRVFDRVDAEAALAAVLSAGTVEVSCTARRGRGPGGCRCGCRPACRPARLAVGLFPAQPGRSARGAGA